jgi:transcription antitermination factor NusG
MKRLFAFLILCAAAFAQTAPKAILGSITSFKTEDAIVVVKPDNTDAVNVKLTPETIFQRVAPGERDLKKATAMNMTDMALGDRVLVSFKPGTTDATRILVMSATDITKRNEADRQDWNKRGVSGVVSAKTGSTITLNKRGMTGEVIMTVTIDDKTAYRRYHTDSVKFADASISKLDEVNIGDQLRARGVKAEDGLKVTAEEIVFGTFVTKAGTITAINAETKEVTVTELGTNKPLTIKFTEDSQIKKMPNMMGMMGGMGGRGGPPQSGAAPAGPARAPDMAQMLERMPAAKLDEFKAGEKIVVSSTKGAKPDEITAIMLLGNADMLIQMATVPSGRGAASGAGGAPNMGGGMGMGGGLQGLDLPSMIMN